MNISNFDMIVTPEMYGATGDGTSDDTTAFSKAIATGLPILLSGKSYVVNFASITSDKLILIGSDEEKSLLYIKGGITIPSLYFNNLSIKLDVSLNAVVYGNKSNLSYKFTNCIIDGCGNANNFVYCETTATVADAFFEKCRFTNFNMSAISMSCTGETCKVLNCNFKNIGSTTSAKTYGVKLGVTVDQSKYFNQSHIKNNIFNTFQSADSAGDDSVECQAIKIASNYSYISNNYIKDILGGGEDHEGIYVKGTNTVVDGNMLINCGHGNGAITLKPVGKGIITNNHVETDGTCVFCGSNCLVENNYLVSDLSSRTVQSIDSADSIYTIVSNFSGNVFKNNRISSIGGTTKASMIKLIGSGAIIEENIMTVQKVDMMVNITNSCDGTLKISNNNIEMTTINNILRFTSVTSGFNVQFGGNTLKGAFKASITSYSSAVQNKTIYAAFTNNTFDLSSYTGTRIFDENYCGTNNTVLIANNYFKLSQSCSSIFINLCCNTRIISNIIENTSSSYFVMFNSQNIKKVEISDNSVDFTTILRVAIDTINCDEIKVINNKFTCAAFFDGSTAKCTSLLIMKNLLNADYKTQISAENSYITDNINYMALNTNA